jgi:hypothetical protein
VPFSVFHLQAQGPAVKRAAAFLDAHAGKFIVAAMILGWFTFILWLCLRGYLRP